MNRKTAAILKALGFAVYEHNAVARETDWILGKVMITVPHSALPGDLPTLMMERAVQMHKNRVQYLRAQLRREEA